MIHFPLRHFPLKHFPLWHYFGTLSLGTIFLWKIILWTIFLCRELSFGHLPFVDIVPHSLVSSLNLWVCVLVPPPKTAFLSAFNDLRALYHSEKGYDLDNSFLLPCLPIWDKPIGFLFKNVAFTKKGKSQSSCREPKCNIKQIKCHCYLCGKAVERTDGRQNKAES